LLARLARGHARAAQVEAALVLLSLLTELSSKRLLDRGCGYAAVGVRSRQVRASIADSSVTALAPAAAASASLPAVLQIAQRQLRLLRAVL
jgi:16S rRNA G1207 methylase RsmC